MSISFSQVLWYGRWGIIIKKKHCGKMNFVVSFFNSSQPYDCQIYNLITFIVISLGYSLVASCPYLPHIFNSKLFILLRHYQVREYDKDIFISPPHARLFLYLSTLFRWDGRVFLFKINYGVPQFLCRRRDAISP